MNSMDNNAIQNIKQILDEVYTERVQLARLTAESGEIFYFKASYDRYLYILQKVIQIKSKGKRVLDVGPGRGHLSVALAKLGWSVALVDVEEKLNTKDMKIMCKKYQMNSKICDLSCDLIPFEDNLFDLIIFTEVIEHLPCNPVNVMKEVIRVLKQGGHLILTTPNQNNLFTKCKCISGKSIYAPIELFFMDNMKYAIHRREYTMDELIYLLDRVGFNIIEKGYFNSKTAKAGLLREVARKIVSFVQFLIPSTSQFLYIDAVRI